MRLAVLDTNVVVSAAINAAGAPAKLLMDWVLDGQVQVVTCPSIVAEYQEVVRREKFARYGLPPQWLDSVIDESLHLPEPGKWPHRLPDPKDAAFLALAHKTGAWLITGNLKHYPKAARNGVTVLPPAEYLSHLGR
jgi:putative PIN family toxin of toxin-antitoxin system